MLIYKVVRWNKQDTYHIDLRGMTKFGYFQNDLPENDLQLIRCKGIGI